MLHHLLGALLLAVQPAAARLERPAPRAAPPVWRIDVAHSDLSFSIRHLVSRVRGTFLTWSGELTADAGAWAAGSVSVTIDAASITTRNERRDADLRSANFFDVAKYPTITYVSRSVEMTGERITVTGDLTMHGVTRPVVLSGELLGTVGEGAAARRVGFHLTGSLNRLDYGVRWNRAAEGGGALLGDDVAIELTVAAVRQP